MAEVLRLMKAQKSITRTTDVPLGIGAWRNLHEEMTMVFRAFDGFPSCSVFRCLPESLAS